MKHTAECGHAGVCAAMLAIAVLLRLATSAQTQEVLRDAAESPAVISALFRLEMGGTAGASAMIEPEPDKPAALETEPEAELQTPEEPEPPRLSFSQADADGVIVSGSSSYTVDPAVLLQHELQLDFSRAGPQVLIIHTHASEAYTPEAGYEYDASDTLRTEDTAYNVVRVGQEMADRLTEQGVSVVHDTQIRDYPTYNGSYTRTLAVIE